ncbi:MAG: hydroxylamine reductase [Candidatus Viridilinea halotolerans]|uniref:Hydroxylamine reductase n=1 Tax=Candidatus Viridilinea halotolerans TaxID=2491704 RepID=A0A426U906_9CHLR|nr:MAG: hydroxylamine reductase [Candidatus Viridilinea halotolerans]
MFCYQCQETTKNDGCVIRGICGKDERLANLQDYLLYALKGLAAVAVRGQQSGVVDAETDLFMAQALFATLTNVNFDAQRIYALTKDAFARREALRTRVHAARHAAGTPCTCALPAAAARSAEGNLDDYATWGAALGAHTQKHPNEDLQALRELITYGVKGLAAYCDHAAMLGKHDPEIYAFLHQALAATLDDNLTLEDLLGIAMRCGALGVTAMALLDAANTERFGHPEPTQVSLGVRPNAPGILISGHDLLDLYDLLCQTQGTGILVYTHGEMLPAHAYPVLKSFPHLAGNYGGAWWEQQRDFAAFNGPLLVTTNCIQTPRESYKERIFTTGMVGYEDVPHIDERASGGQKDFSPLIKLALTCPPPLELETGSIQVGFARKAVLDNAEAVLEAVQTGAIRRFVVMAGCDGRHKEREYYTDVAKALPQDTIILTAGCAKYRYNKLDLGSIGGFPRVLDAGQCNDSYSLVAIAQALASAVGAENINDLPISYDIAWYEQKAVLVLLALLHLGVKGIRLGPTLPAFLTPNVANFLIENFAIKGIGTAEEDVEAMLAGA